MARSASARSLAWLRDRVAILAQAMSIVHRPAAFLAVVAKRVVWALEAAALKLILLGFGPLSIYRASP